MQPLPPPGPPPMLKKGGEEKPITNNMFAGVKLRKVAPPVQKEPVVLQKPSFDPLKAHAEEFDMDRWNPDTQAWVCCLTRYIHLFLGIGTI